MQLFIAINEAVNNAFFHGINDHKGTQVIINITRNEQGLYIVVSHNGEGIEELGVCHPTCDLYNEGGRGIEIIRHYVDSLEFSACGCKLTMYKQFDVSPE